MMTPDEAIKMLPYWQGLLGLQHWEIKVKVCRHKEMYGGSNLGSVWFQKNLEQAVIYLLDPIDYNAIELDGFTIDAEQSLVHELLHLVFLIEERDDHDEEVMERGINRLAKVLVRRDCYGSTPGRY